MSLQRFILILAFLIVSSSSLIAQWSIGGTPISKQRFGLTINKVPSIVTPVPDSAKLLAKDKLEEAENIPPRFGVPYPVLANLNSTGKWDEVLGGRIWRLVIKSPAAQTINLNYDDFYLPRGAKLFISALDGSHTLGAFTAANNKSNGQFATGFVRAEEVVLEYFEPSEVRGEGRISISEVIYGYRSTSKARQIFKDYGDSQSCMVNVNCGTGSDYDEIKKSVALITTAGNFRYCTGVLINNVAEDCRPYFLSANHCFQQLNDDQIRNSIFIFNYETPGCQNPNEEPSTDQSVQGCEIIARGAISDFTLLELSEHPGLAPNIPGGVYLAGWNRNANPGSSSFTIHHPEGDVKKISTDNQAPTQSQWMDSGLFNTHWRARWEEGVTAVGSSGGPLFNQNGEVIGQLHGGNSDCLTPQGSDVYGKFSFSWESNGSELSAGLKSWLDPNDEDLFQLDGMPCEGFNGFDATLSVIHPIGETCETEAPLVKLINNGLIDLTLLIAQLSIDGEQIQNIAFTETLTSFESEVVNFDAIAPMAGEHILEVCLIGINGSNDEQTNNNCVSHVFGCDIETGIENEILSMSVSPNPSRGIFTIMGLEGEFYFQIFDASGKPVARTNFDSTSQLDLSSLTDGLYFLRVTQDSKSSTHRIVLLR